MRLRNIPGADEHLEKSDFVVKEPLRFKGQWSETVFGNSHPLYIEIGCGKGAFLMALAERHPENNYIGIEKMSSVLLRAVEKAEDESRGPLKNIRFLRFDAEEITSLFDIGEASGIYLNFSDPWPKDRHRKRRLTSKEYLSRYEKILGKDAVVEFKTDNTALFDFSLEEVKEAGWEVLFETRDLHKSEQARDNIMTEYEDRFATLGNKICKLIMKPGEFTANSQDTILN